MSDEKEPLNPAEDESKGDALRVSSSLLTNKIDQSRQSRSGWVVSGLMSGFGVTANTTNVNGFRGVETLQDPDEENPLNPDAVLSEESEDLGHVEVSVFFKLPGS